MITTLENSACAVTERVPEEVTGNIRLTKLSTCIHSLIINFDFNTKKPKIDLNKQIGVYMVYVLFHFRFRQKR